MESSPMPSMTINSTATTIAFCIRNVLPQHAQVLVFQPKDIILEKISTRLSQRAGFVRRIIEDINKSTAK
jgi:hypothetical protein